MELKPLHQLSKGNEMNDVTKLVEAHLALWAITDSNDRAAQIAQSYTPDANVVEPDGVVVGREALNTRIGQLQEHFGGLSFIVNGSIEHHNGYASYLWAQPATAKSDEVRGWDVLHFDGDLIDCVVMFIPDYDKLSVPGHTVD
jgi:hypothetical protein